MYTSCKALNCESNVVSLWPRIYVDTSIIMLKNKKSNITEREREREREREIRVCFKTLINQRQGHLKGYLFLTNDCR